MNNELEIDRKAVQHDLERSASFGMVDTDDGIGRTVLTGTPANFAARNYFVDQLVTAGLDVSVDAVGNITGRWSPPECDESADPVAAGSHLDSVPEGGIFDGPLGVYAALEAVRTLKRSAWTVDRPIEVVCFTGEEGTRFADGVLGSSVAAGKHPLRKHFRSVMVRQPLRRHWKISDSAVMGELMPANGIHGSNYTSNRGCC